MNVEEAVEVLKQWESNPNLVNPFDLRPAIRTLLDAQPTPTTVQEPLSEAVRTAPKAIYLQISDDESHLGETFPDEHFGEITWCSDSVLDAEVKYIRADLATPAQPTDERDVLLETAADWCQSESDKFCIGEVENELWEERAARLRAAIKS